MKSRREFLRHAACATTALLGAPGLLGTAAALGAPREPRLVSPGSLNYASFARLLGTAFWIPGSASQEQWLALTKVHLNQSQPELECFSLVFLGSDLCPLSQGTYWFYHGQLGLFQMFIVPQPPESGHRPYEAVFNRLVEGTIP